VTATVITSPEGAVAKYCGEYVCVCVSVCLSVREHISGTTRAIFASFCAHIADGRGSVLRRQGDEIPRGRGDFGGCLATQKQYSNLRCSHRCRVRCKRDNSIANNVMQQTGSFMEVHSAGEV